MNADPDAKPERNDTEGRRVRLGGRTSVMTIMMAVAVAAAVFALDLAAPLGVAGGVPYVLLVLMGWWFQERLAVFLLAAASSALTLVGFFLSPAGGLAWVVLTNRAYALSVIWATAVVLWWSWRERTHRRHRSMKERWHGIRNNALMGREGTVVLAMSAVVLAASWGVITRIEEGARLSIDESMKTVLRISHVSIRNQFDDSKKAVMIWADDTQLRTTVVELADLSRDAEILINSRAQKSLRTLVTPVIRTVGYRGFFVIGIGNINLASTRDSNVGAVNLLTKQGDFLDRVWAGETLISLPQLSDVPLEDMSGERVANLATMFVATPIEGANGEVIAILALRLDPDRSFIPVFSRGNLGATGETYAFDRKGLLISESRFNDHLMQVGLITGKHSDLNVEIRDPGVNTVLGHEPSLPRHEQPLTRMAQSATAGESGSDMDGYRDYRGVPVVGTWLWDEELGFGIATEVEVEEAFASFNQMRLVILVFSGLFIGVLIVLAIVASRDRKRMALDEKRYRDLYENAPCAYASVASSDGSLLEFNRGLVQLLGYDRDELGRMSALEFYADTPDGLPKAQEAFEEFRSGRKLVTTELQMRRKDGEVIWVSLSVDPIIDAPGNVTASRSVVVDITDRKRAEEEIKAALKEKEVLLQEIHHRVKNNLQVISSMLRLQASAESNTHTVEALLESQRRVLIMARMHEYLHRSDGLADINAKVFLGALVDDTRESSGDVSQHLSFHVDVGDILLDVDHANAYGQIVSELLSNVLKYAFTSGQPGNVEISLRRLDGGGSELRVVDDGKGLPDDFDLKRTRSLGLRLVCALAEKFGGAVHIDGSDGTRVQIDFPEEPPC